MRKNTINYFWFTLIEILVAIAIVAIIALSSTKFNFNNVSNKQKLKTFNNNIVSNIEIIRNNSLMWRGVWTSLIIPKSWRIDFSKSWSWKILVSYSSWWTDYPEKNIVFNWGYYLNTINCFKINDKLLDTFTWSTLWTWTLIVSWNSITWSGSSLCDDITNKKIEIITWFKNFTWSILINTVNWLIETK